MKSGLGATTTGHLKYRPDIDGLRALAILPVILYHAKLACPGGFVGVDVFFVISGFLITSLILQEMADGTFSLINFWERRIRRILPALTAVALATLVAAAYLFLPEDFALVGRSVAAVAVLGANFFFMKQSGYFAPGSDTKPLLHTWSLAVEEQCYVLFPLLLLVLAYFKKHPGLKLILLLAIGSFVLSVAGTYSVNNQRSTFFLLPARSWELMLGALLAMRPKKLSAGGGAREIFGWLGLALIGGSVFFYSTETRFPGLAAMPPCLGAALVIFSSEARLSSVGRVLAFRPLVFVGLISYSLYLWHWPLLAFAAYLSISPPNDTMQIRLLAVSFALAILSWQFIEKPFRQRRIFQRRPHIFAFAGASLVALLSLGLVVGRWHGFPARFPASVMVYANARFHSPYLDDPHMAKPWVGHLVTFSTKSTNQPVDLVIWGDSHAKVLTPVLDQLCQKQGWLDMDTTFRGTAPVVGGFTRKSGLAEPGDDAIAVLRFISQCQPRPRVVLIAARWSGYVASESFKSNIVATVQAVLKLGVRVYVVKDVPIPEYNVPRFAALATMHGADIRKRGMTPTDYREANREVQPVFEQIARLGATVLDPTPYFLNSNGLYGVEKDGVLLYSDADHMTIDGSMILAPLFEPIFHAH